MTDARPVVLITGGAGGMGQAIARRYADSAGAVLLADLDAARLDCVRQELASASARIATSQVDLRRVEDCARAVAAAVALGGRLDIVVNAAGVWVEGPSAGMTEADFDQVIGVNLKGTFFICRHAIPHLIATRGAILNIASDAGLVGNPGAAIYCASKGGVVQMTRALARELAPHGVRVNALCPSDVDSPMLHGQAARYGAGDAAGYLARLRASYPQGAGTRFITVDEIAAAVEYFCSPIAAPFTGAAIAMDFGVTAGYGAMDP